MKNEEIKMMVVGREDGVRNDREAMLHENPASHDLMSKIKETLLKLSKGGGCSMSELEENLNFLRQNKDKLTLVQTLELAALEFMQK